MSPSKENSFEFMNSGIFQNYLLIFTYKFKKANSMFQRNSNDLFIILLIIKYNIMQDIEMLAVAFSMKKRFSICSNGYGFRWFSSKMGYISID
ncbi:hypothetical protein T4C_9229 [Trichinella pseudospiralis]|uniref:Uncharacterized protein n=2 Tax=Trichinella pseudospiralis TaxID=6337 RepID=A0A0V1JXV5_TRIPS|nr:hypothetical protein T4C_9229 [Trichinella pseudospiralis]